MAICDLQRRLRGAGDVLPVDQDAAPVHVVEPLDQLDERRLAGAGMADQADALARPDRHREIAVERQQMAAVVERHMLERNAALADADGRGIVAIGDAERLPLDVDQLLHVVDRALQVADVHADIAQIALQQEEGGEHEGDVAGARLPARPQQQRKADDRDAQHQQRGALRRAVDGAAHPGAARAAAPFGDDLGKARVLARFRAEGLDHRVAADRVRERAAEPACPSHWRGWPQARHRRATAPPSGRNRRSSRRRR